MTIEMRDKKQPRVIKANYVLQAKVGSGPLDQKTVDACQEVMDNNDVDFAPLAMEFLDKLSVAIKHAKSDGADLKTTIQEMAQPVMQLKANAAIFKYDLIGKLANVMLSFLESVRALDKTVIEIVDAHHKTLTAIVLKKMKGDGGTYGVQLEQELKDACLRYLQKKKAG
jgi:hypothetical protein